MERNKEKEIFEGKWYTHPSMRNALISGVLTSIAFSLAHLKIIPFYWETVIFIIAIIIGSYHWSLEGIEELFKEKVMSINILMMAATIGSVILNMYDEAAFLVFLYGAAEGLEEYTYAKARYSIRKLLDLAPKEAQVIRDGKEIIIPAKELNVDEIFIVRPGESIATDGVIIKGKSSINEASVTGESLPVEKKEGMKVFAGTINQEGALEIKVTTIFEDNTLSKMIHLVEEAQEQKGKAQLFIENFGSKYTPLVFLLALLLIIIPPLLGYSFSFWATRAVVFLVAAAPCALIMSTPVAIATGIGRAGSHGVLIKGGAHLENLGKIKVVCFDKTGTLTKGKPIVTDVIAFNGSESYTILSLAYNIERFSEHPLAKAIVEKAKEWNIQTLDTKDFTSITGHGAKAVVEGKTIYVGKKELIKRDDKSASLEQAEKLRTEGKTVIYVGTDEGSIGIIAIRDEIRTNAKEVIKRLHEMKIKVSMLTGDNDITAKAIANELNIDEVKANLKPKDKIEAIKELEKKYGAVAMVGDGVNDAPALAQATIGMAMGTAGSDAAIEAANIALMADDLQKVPYAISLGKVARKISRQNIVFSLFVLAILIPSALTGIMSIAYAVFFHETSELLAVANGLRVKN